MRVRRCNFLSSVEAMPASALRCGRESWLRPPQITVVLADDFPNYSVCGLPFYVSGETPAVRQLAVCSQKRIFASRRVSNVSTADEDHEYHSCPATVDACLGVALTS